MLQSNDSDILLTQKRLNQRLVKVYIVSTMANDVSSCLCSEYEWRLIISNLNF